MSSRIFCRRRRTSLQCRTDDDWAAAVELARLNSSMTSIPPVRAALRHRQGRLEEDNDGRHTTSAQEDVLARLRHGPSLLSMRLAVHLGSTCDHVLHVVSVSWAVDAA